MGALSTHDLDLLHDSWLIYTHHNFKNIMQ